MTEFKRTAFLAEPVDGDGLIGMPEKWTAESARHPRLDNPPYSDLPQEVLEELRAEQEPSVLLTTPAGRFFIPEHAFQYLLEFVQRQREAAA